MHARLLIVVISFVGDMCMRSIIFGKMALRRFLLATELRIGRIGRILVLSTAFCINCVDRHYVTLHVRPHYLKGSTTILTYDVSIFCPVNTDITS